ncbi:hypothetical protein ACWET9_22615 [Streptomyces sp. NPDC004059]
MPESTATPQAEPTPTNDGTPTNDPQAALHWAAVAIGLANAREEQGNPLTDAERTVFYRYQDAARAHGFTGEQVLDYLNNTLRPQAAQ